MSSLRRIVATSGVIAIVVTGGASAASVNGTWKGRLLDPQLTGPEVPAEERAPIGDFPITTLVVRTAKLELRVKGVTMATHDPPTATSSCSLPFRFALVQAGWRVYRQAGRMRLGGSVSGGPPALSACSAAGPAGGAIRVRPAGAKLKTEFASFYRPDQGAANWEGGPLRGYLAK